MVRLWWDGQHDDLWFDLHSLCGQPGFEHVRPRDKAAGVAGIGVEDIGSQGQAGKEAEKYREGSSKASKELSTETEKIIARKILDSGTNCGTAIFVEIRLVPCLNCAQELLVSSTPY